MERLASIIPAVPPSIIVRKLVRDLIERTEGEVPKNVVVED